MQDPSWHHISGLHDPASNPLEQPLIRLSSFHYEATHGAALDLSQLTFHEADTHAMSLSLESNFALEALIPSSTRKLIPSSVKKRNLSGSFLLMWPFSYFVCSRKPTRCFIWSIYLKHPLALWNRYSGQSILIAPFDTRGPVDQSL